MRKGAFFSIRSAAAAVLFILYGFCCTGPGGPAPDDNGLAAHSPSTDEFSDLVETAREKNGIPGLAAVILTSEGIRNKAVSGVRRVGSDDPLSLSDRFHIGSNTKAMTSFLAAILVEKGLIRWDSKISDVFPDWAGKMRDAYRSVTLIDLLMHTAGILPFKHGLDFERLPESIYAGSAADIRQAFAEWLIQQEPASAGPQGFTYSNAGYSVAAALLEKAAGRSWENMMQEELFSALGIAAGPGWPAAEDEQQPWGHWLRGGRLVAHDPGGDYQLHEIIAPAGDLNMSILDYSKFLRIILKGLKGEDTLVGPDTIHFLLYGERKLPPYSAGWGSARRNGLTISSHDGSAGTFYCHVFLVKELGLAVALMANSASERTTKGLHALRRGLVDRYRDPGIL